MKTIANIIWLIFGCLMALAYFVAGVLSMLTIIGIGNGLQSFKLGRYALWPFGKTVVKTSSGPVGCLAMVANVFWWVLGGVWLSLGHVILGLLFFILIVTIPFAGKHFELAKLAWAPYGKDFAET